VSKHLPDDMPTAAIGEISTLVTSGSTPLGGRKRYGSAGIPFIRSMNVLPGRLELHQDVCIPADVHREMARSRVVPGDVLLNITGEGTLGRAAVVPDTIPEANINQHVCLIRPIVELVDSRYLAYILNSGQCQDQMAQLQAGATRAALNHRLVKSLRVPLPSLAEQRRIMARIEEIVQRVQEANTLQALARDWAANLLPAALRQVFQDRTGWEEWRWATLRETSGTDGLFTDGDWILSKNMSPVGEVRLIQLADIGECQFLDVSAKVITRDTLKKLACTLLAAGDVLVSRMAAPIAKACVLPQLPYESITAVDVTVIRVDPNVAEPRFIMYACNSPVVREQAEALARGSTRSRITRKDLEQIRIPLPPITRQRRIIEYLDTLQSQASQLCRVQEETRGELDALLPAVLEKAYRGEL